MKKTRVVFRTGKKLGRTLAIFPDTLVGEDILAYDNPHLPASITSIMKHTRHATVDAWEDLFFQLHHHCTYECLSLIKR